MKFDIPYPCSEDWNKMKIGIDGRFCDSCEKTVVDFTQKTREEIVAYLLLHRQDRVCGHIRKSQLDFHYTDMMVVIRGMTVKEKKSNLPFYILCAGALLLSSCSTNTTTGKIVGEDAQVTDSIEILKDSTKIDSTVTGEPIKHLKGMMESDTNDNPIELSISGEVMDGDMIIIDPDEHLDIEPLPDSLAEEDQYDPVLSFAEVMPEYPYGIDSLMEYMQNEIKYPPRERDLGIEGTVYAQFVVERSGEITDIKIVRSVPNAPAFDKEVIRMIEKMPFWNPGMNNGKLARVRFTIPVKFRIND